MDDNWLKFPLVMNDSLDTNEPGWYKSYKNEGNIDQNNSCMILTMNNNIPRRELYLNNFIF